MRIPFVEDNPSTNRIIRFSILFYWSIFWLFNIIDKAKIFHNTCDALDEFDIVISLSARRRDINKKHISDKG